MSSDPRHPDDAGDEVRRRLEEIKKALAINPDDEDLNRQAATAFEKLKDFDNAIQCWERIAKQLPNDKDVRRAILSLLVHKTIHSGPQEPDEASKYVSRAIEHAQEYTMQGDLASAERVMQEAVDATGSIRAREYLEDIQLHRLRGT